MVNVKQASLNSSDMTAQNIGMKNTTQYDASILEQFADDLYSRARWVVLTTAAKYGVVGIVLSLLLALAVLQYQVNPPIPNNTVAGLVIVFTLVAITLGVSAGRAKAFQLKLQAQQILCQRQIEVNTRAVNDWAGRAKASATPA